MVEQGSFRQRLDAVLRTLDVKKVQEFLIAQKQWSEGQPQDPEFAMWMMIAGAPSLLDLHERAYQWLTTHGHEADAAAFLAREKKTGAKGGTKQVRNGSPSRLSNSSGKKPNSRQSTSNSKRQGLSKGETER